MNKIAKKITREAKFKKGWTFLIFYAVLSRITRFWVNMKGPKSASKGF